MSQGNDTKNSSLRMQNNKIYSLEEYIANLPADICHLHILEWDNYTGAKP